MHILFVALLIYASYTDIKKREIPIAVPICISILSLFSFHPLGILACVPFLIVALINPENMGGGDIKLIASTGLFLGLQSTMLGVILGLTSSIIFYIVSGRKIKNLPLAPFLTTGFLIIILGGI